MKIVKDIALVILAVIAVLLVIPLGLALSAYVGYFFGIIVAWLAGYVLATSGIEGDWIPTITAWLFVAGSIIGVGGSASTKAGE